ncbi:MAG: hypothetical protein R3C14_02100 [Caldilineaceae bacterium]
MTVLTLELPDELSSRIEPMRSWLPTILELSLLGLRTPAVVTATEIVEFLSGDPSQQEVMNYAVTERGQARLQRLLALNDSELLSMDEEHELDELAKIERIMVMLKAQVAATLQHGKSTLAAKGRQ